MLSKLLRHNLDPDIYFKNHAALFDLNMYVVLKFILTT